MGQTEVCAWLKEKRLAGDERYWTSKEVEAGLKEKGFSSGVLKGIRGDLIRLELYDLVEIRMNGKLEDWKRLYRFKVK